MPFACLTYSEFIEMFEPSKEFIGYEDDGQIYIEWKIVPCKSPVRESGGWCAFLWKPVSEEYYGKWIRQEYNGSSPFAMWWSRELEEYECNCEFVECCDTNCDCDGHWRKEVTLSEKKEAT
jgi:hypothetical protein